VVSGIRRVARGCVGSKTEMAALKKNFLVPSPCVATADMNRVIRSEEIQNEVRPPKKDFGVKSHRCKPNPLTNFRALEILNPYAAKVKQTAQEEAARAVKKERKAKNKDKELEAAKKHFRSILRKESDYQGEDYDQFSKWLGLTQ